VLSSLVQSLDFELLAQMIAHGTMGGNDFVEVFQKVFSVIESLQAPARLEAFHAWRDHYLTALATSNGTNSGSSSRRESILPLVPKFFEFAGACIDQIQRDVSTIPNSNCTDTKPNTQTNAQMPSIFTRISYLFLLFLLLLLLLFFRHPMCVLLDGKFLRP
jgi:hypothetical protein